MTKIAFIGAGNMNGAIIRGLVQQGVEAQSIIVSNPSPEKRVALANELGIQHTDSNIEAANFADYVILGVKPHYISDVCQELVDNVYSDVPWDEFWYVPFVLVAILQLTPVPEPPNPIAHELREPYDESR